MKPLIFVIEGFLLSSLIIFRWTVEPQFNEILVITNTIQKSKRKIYLDITNKCQHVRKEEYHTDQQG